MMNYFQFHLNDYAEATAHLSFIEDAAYVRLLRKYYAQECPFPDDLRTICRLIVARTDEEKAAVSTVLHEFFALIGGQWVHERCDSEIAHYQEKCGKAAASAKTRWANSKRNANALQTQCEGNANQEPITNNQEPITSKPKERAAAIALPDWLPESSWKDWCDYRRSRKGFTHRAQELSIKELGVLRESGYDPVQIIEQSICNGWAGLFPKKGDTRKQPDKSSDFLRIIGGDEIEVEMNEVPCREKLS